MPMITFSARDILKGKTVTPSWYRVHIESVGEALSKDKMSTNYPVEGTIVFNGDNGSKEFEGVPLDWNFNSKAVGFAKGYFAAFGIEITAGTRYELANSAGKDLDVFVANKEYDGRIINDVQHKYRPCRDVSAPTT